MSIWDWVPQDGFPMKVTQYGARAHNQCEPGKCPHKNAEGFKNCPFFSEQYLYELLGKEDARTLLALLRKIEPEPRP